MIAEERSGGHGTKQALAFPVGMLIRSPKKRLAMLSRKTSNGSLQSSRSDSTAQSGEGPGVRQPAKSKIRRHNNRLITVFNRSPVLPRDGPARDHAPSQPSNQSSFPGILKVYGSHISHATNYKSVLATAHSTAQQLVKEALERYCLEHEDPSDYVLCEAIGRAEPECEWKSECFRVVGDLEKPLVLQSFWKPKEGFARRFEIQRRTTAEAQSTPHTCSTTTPGLKLPSGRARVTSMFLDHEPDGDADPRRSIWRSLSDMDVSTTGGVQEEQEETESNTHYSIRLPFHLPYFLLLQGFSHTQDFLIYLMSGSCCVFGRSGDSVCAEDAQTQEVDVQLFASDILPRHCLVRREDQRTFLKPLESAPVTHNGVELHREAELCPGDLVGLGRHYLFMFKDPTASAASQTPSWMSALCPASTPSPSPVRIRRAPPSPDHWRDQEGRALALSYQPQQEDLVLDQILHMVEQQVQEPSLSAAFLLCLCVQRSALSFHWSCLRTLLLRIASRLQITTWERTKEVAALQPDIDSSAELLVPDLKTLIPGLRPLVLWMSNSIELLRFIQHEVPQLLTWRRQQEPDTELLDAEIRSTCVASEEAMTVLEEVIMFTFQQCVYYFTKMMYAALPALLDSNPFSESGRVQTPAGVGRVLEVLGEALQLLRVFQVHGQVTSQLLAYLFFFIDASLFNTLMERGPGRGFYQWSRGVQMRANLDTLMEWTQSAGLGTLAAQFLLKLSSAINLLATPKNTLMQASWCSLRAEFVHLNAAQLHHMLSQYNSGRTSPASWTPAPEDSADALQTSEILESFDSHPPLLLPSSAFHLEPGRTITEQKMLTQLQLLQEHIHSLTGSAQDVMEEIGSTSFLPEPHWTPEPITGREAAPRSDLTSCEALLTQKLKSLELQSLCGEAERSYHKSLALDPSCLLTPPNTPQSLEHTAVSKVRSPERKSEEEEDEREEVFTVELTRGAHGLGLALVDGMRSALRTSGIYVRWVVPDSPAALSRTLREGDRILAVNGVSLVGVDYHSGQEMIRTATDSLRLLVAKSEWRRSITRC